MNEDEFINALVKAGLRRDSAARLSSINEISSRGTRAFGVIDLLGWPQIVEFNSRDGIPAEANMPIVAIGMDGRWVLLDCDRQSVVFCDQFDPGYPSSFTKTQIDLKLSLQNYLSGLIENSSKVPADYEEALRLSGRTWEW